MFRFYWALCLAVVVKAVSASTEESQFFLHLLRRQAPGSPAFNCHDNCGQAVIASKKSDDVCNDNAFLTDYKNCLQCSGPDNEDIWKWYGNTLTKAAEPCGLSTTPLCGDQPDVGPAVAVGPTPSNLPTSGGTVPTPTPTATNGPTTDSPTEGATSTAGETSVPIVTESATITSAPVSSSTEAGDGAANTTTSSTTAQVDGAVRVLSDGFLGRYMALVVSLLYAIAQ
ncbi:hypothetical protein F4779DRAFT_569426 [Xylariaceae sp. FL0662B]|nr:hypothetical protein F4779DRAFT_569426 [Xylariaceae sp. FL0662B]